jgi:beta-glucanase (GH16 family)
MQLQFVNRMGMCLMLLFSIVSGAFAQAPAGYTKVWEDTFDGTSLDTNNWTIGCKDTATGDMIPGAIGQYLLNNAYAGYITEEDVWVAGGNLYLQNQKRSYQGTSPSGWFNYTTGWITSLHKVHFNQGYLEMRAQYPSGDKVWPAYWLIAEDLIWGPEWDIYEYFGYRSDYGYDVMMNALAYGTYPNISWLGDGDGPLTNFDATYDCESWHVYGFEWTSEYAKFYVDGAVVSQINNTIGSNWPNEEMYIVLNNGVKTDSPDTNTTWPNHVVVDYIELYQGSLGPEPSGNITVVNSSFEEPGTVKYNNWESIPGWSSDTVAADSGVESGGTNGAWQGFLMGSDPAVWQLTDHVLGAGETLTLTVDATVTAGATALTMTLYYDNAGSRVTAATQQVSLTSGWQTFTLIFNADAVPAAIGKRIGILLDNPSGVSDWIGIDNIRFSVEEELSPGDLTGDGKVNMEDLAELGKQWQNGYDIDTLLEIVNNWLYGVE